ncbi:hypothetical protein GCM10009037_19800 [Halarchaeum grantii]|uniref:Uncharacterized protein n=1 Tax=Halarchaeum grantii TaxID=1193105 RepID=A0A830F378_9EURY|nr:hypothetical protein [Halarchaeum grantii]GGL36268.1 hypothetical protein GCM10009037_19800 [Halarchaeum grantii]
MIGHNIDTQRNDASERYRMLATYGLLAQHDDGYYSLSEQGEAYLNEELDATDLTE